MFHDKGQAHFEADVTFHFSGHVVNRRNWFVFGEDLYRRAPMDFKGVEGLNTVEMLADRPGKFYAGDSVRVRCRVLCPELFDGVLAPGASFRLWDGYFFADGRVTRVLKAESAKN